jgi:RNA polymerase sigma factor (sigma-70 family)
VTTNDNQWLASRFEAHRARLRAVGYRMLGSLSEADDAVQGTWLRLSRSDPNTIDNLGGWLTTAVARECLDMLRARSSRREEPLEVRVPDPVVSPPEGTDPEHEVLAADSVGLALLVVMEALTPPERVAFVLHDVFAVPYDEIAPIVDRSPEATRQLASRARRRVRGTVPAPDTDLARQRAVVDAFLAAAGDGDFEALLAVLDPNVMLHADAGATPGAPTRVLRGARQVAGQAVFFSKSHGRHALPALVNGAAGVVAVSGDEVLSVMGFTISAGRIVEIDILADPERLRELEWSTPG